MRISLYSTDARVVGSCSNTLCPGRTGRPKANTFKRLLLLGFIILTATGSIFSEGIVTECTESALRQALEGGGTVTFGCDGVILMSNSIEITVNTTIDASGRSVILSGGGKVRLFSFPQTDRLITLKGLTISDGYAPEGGAISLMGASVVLVRCKFENNVAKGIPGRGGAVAARGDGGRLQIEDCTFLNNRAEGSAETPQISGGGGAIFSSAILTATNCSFVSNRAALFWRHVLLPTTSLKGFMACGVPMASQAKRGRLVAAVVKRMVAPSHGTKMGHACGIVCLLETARSVAMAEQAGVGD
jgi:hypothetical protein